MNAANVGRTWVPRFLLVGASLAIVEAGLQLCTLASPRAEEVLAPEISGWVPDGLLGERGNPRYPEHDVAGYRNSDRPARASIVVLGDSQAYGVSVRRDEAWPHLLESSTGRRVYNMALPGYCPVHSLWQFDEALTLSPQQVIVSVYFGNDMFDAFVLSLQNAAIAALAPHDLVAESRAKEAAGPLEEELYPPAKGWYNVGISAFLRLRTWTAVHSRLYGVARAARRLSAAPADPLSPADSGFETAVRSLTSEKRASTLIVDRPGWRTILTPAYRGRVEDDSDVRIREGFEVVKGSLNSLANRSRSAGVKLLVVLIPTKETVLWSRADQTNPALSRLLDNESRLKTELFDFLSSRDIDVVDVSDRLGAATRQPYFENADGHPNAWGHRVIADAIIEHGLDGRQQIHPIGGTPR